MKLSVIAFNDRGGLMAKKIQTGLPGHEIDVYIKPDTKVSDWAREQFEAKRGMIFVGACGIAVRAIAPLVNNKLTDPPVLVVDDEGRYVISVLSGHVGGANILAVLLAAGIGAKPVVTTASDIGLEARPYVVGIGCRKGKTEEEIEAFVSEHIASLGIEISDIFAVASIDQKREEAGLCEWVEAKRLSFVTFSGEELETTGDGFSSSEFVKKTVGVDNVCERAALLACGRGGELILKKQAKNGITVAVAKRKLRGQ